jgi:hypothetical protein
MKNELALLDTPEVNNESEVVELNDLQLALIGGGAGETILH